MGFSENGEPHRSLLKGEMGYDRDGRRPGRQQAHGELELGDWKEGRSFRSRHLGQVRGWLGLVWNHLDR